MSFKRKVMHKLMKIFLLRKAKTCKLMFVGWNFEQRQDDSVLMNQTSSVQGLEELDLDMVKGSDSREVLGRRQQCKFRSGMGSLNWFATSTMPQITFDVLTLSMRFGKSCVQDYK